MPELNYIAIAIATVGAFLASAIWYGVFPLPSQPKTAPGDKPDAMPPWKIVLELLRSLTVAVVLAILLKQVEPDSAFVALGYAALLWLAFPAVLLGGAVIHEGASKKAAVLHASDWLIKLALIALVVYFW